MSEPCGVCGLDPCGLHEEKHPAWPSTESNLRRPWCCPEPKCRPVFQIKDTDWDLTAQRPGESFFCFGMLKEPVVFVYDGNEHKNDTRSCTFTPLKGLITFHENIDDWEWLSWGYKRAREKVMVIRSHEAAKDSAAGEAK